MRPRLIVSGSTLAICAAMLLPGTASAGHAAAPKLGTSSGARLLTHTVPAVVGKARQVGALRASRTLHVAIPLVLRNQPALDRLLAAEYTPGSAQFHRFLTPARFGQQFGAPAAEVSSASRALTSLGLTVAAPSANHLYLKAAGSVATLERAFGTRIENFRLPSGLAFFANTTNITLPRQLAGSVTGVIGLDDADRPVPQLAAAQPAQPAQPAASGISPIGQDGGSTPCPAAVAGAGYTSPQLASAYDFNGLYGKGLLGQGMSAALVEFDDYHTSNVVTAESCYGSHTKVGRRVVDGGTGGPPAGGEVEDMADITTLLEMLPKLAHLYVYVAPITNLGEIDLYSRFATDNIAPVLSASWGNCEELNSQADNRLFSEIAAEAAAQGQQILTASGDSGAVDCRGYPPPTSQSISVEEEAAVPWVTGVGGTDLGQNTANGISDTRHEATWNSDGAGGGGVSTLWPMPAWQHRLASARTAPGHSAANCGAVKGQLCREVPDISADADPGLGQQGDGFQFTNDTGSPGYSIYCGTPNCTLTTLVGLPPLPLGPPGGTGGWFPIGGTSLATPLTAAAALLWDQEAKVKNLPRLGMLNPSLYRVASSPKRYARDFHDITTDSNSAQYDTTDCPAGCNPHHLYRARKGYDMASGLGSYDAANLGADIVDEAGRIEATPDHVTVYGYTHGVATHLPVIVSNGHRRPSYTVHSNRHWLHVHLGTAQRLRWRASPKGLTPGTRHGIITVRSHGKKATVAVRYTVTKHAKLRLSAKRLHFAERAVTSSDKPTTATCNATLWNDELYDAVNDSTGTKVDPATKRTLRITNAGPRGSALHWRAFAYSKTGGWLGVDLTRGKIATRRARPIEATGGTLRHESTSALHLAATANINTLAGYPAMNQGRYGGLIRIYDLADPGVVRTIHTTLRLGNGKKTPTIHGRLSARKVSLAKGQTKTVTLKLSDASKHCGYAYSVSSSRRWASPDANDFSGVVPATGSGAAGGSDTGAGTGTIPIRVSARTLAVGSHVVTFTVQSQNAAPNNVKIHLLVRVTH